jgi:hypothetical protein
MHDRAPRDWRSGNSQGGLALRCAACLGRKLGRKSPLPGICGDWCGVAPFCAPEGRTLVGCRVTGDPRNETRLRGQCHLLLPGPARGDDPYPLCAVGHHHRPVLTIDPAADQPRWLICRPRRNPDRRSRRPDPRIRRGRMR